MKDRNFTGGYADLCCRSGSQSAAGVRRDGFAIEEGKELGHGRSLQPCGSPELFFVNHGSPIDGV